MPVLRRKINCGLVKSKFKSLGIILYSGTILSIILGKYMQKLWKNMTESVHWSAQVVDFHKKSKIEVELVLTELDGTKIITWNFHVGYSQGDHKYNMILGRGILY